MHELVDFQTEIFINKYAHCMYKIGKKYIVFLHIYIYELF